MNNLSKLEVLSFQCVTVKVTRCFNCHCRFFFRDSQSAKATAACPGNGTGVTVSRIDGSVRNWVLRVRHGGRLPTLAMHLEVGKVSWRIQHGT